MKIMISIASIDPNPHRNLERNPVDPTQVAKVIDSISRTGFWDNLVVRPHPDVPGRYQIAYGHNRLEACWRVGITEADLPVIALSDYDMLCCMIDENNTQQQITPKIVFENVIAALTLAERFLNSTENVGEFNNLLKTSNRSRENDAFFGTTEYYSRAKNAIGEHGNGLGKDVIKHFLPTHAVPGAETLQNAIDSYYADRRQPTACRARFEKASCHPPLARNCCKLQSLCGY